MSYTFQNLSPADFEDLARDLVGRELGVRFEAFAAGPDGGMDGRHAKGRKSIVLQAKHYAGSSFAVLSSSLKRERTAIDKLAPQRYVLVTSRAITPQNKIRLAEIIGSALKESGDLFGPDDLNGLLRKFPDVEKSNIKLWLSSRAVLERIVQSAAYAFTAMSRAEIEAKVNVYAPNPSFSEAKQKLESNHVLIISGPPGVGKTTLAEMLSYAYIGEEWEFVAIRSLDDGFAKIVDTKKQVFFFDDFLGKIALDVRSLATKDSELAKFIKRVRSSPNGRFILTTRAYIFEEARRFSEHLADQRLDITRYLLDVGIYTRRIKARILYNHLIAANPPKQYIRVLIQEGVLAKIIDHKNYNPRIIEAMTDALRLKEIDSGDYAKAFISALDNPHQLWDVAFRTHISPMCRHLLFSLFFCSEYGVALGELKIAFNALHPVLCKRYGLPHDPKDFEDAVRVMEGGFINIRGRTVSFINPSLRDYLDGYLDDVSLLSAFAVTAQKVSWARSIWKHVSLDPVRFSSDDHVTLSVAFRPIAAASATLPVMKQDPEPPHYYTNFDRSVSDRIELLLSWAGIANDEVFVEAALALIRKPVGGFSSWRDGKNLIDLVYSLRSGEYEGLECAEEMTAILESAIADVFDDPMDPDDLEAMCDAVDACKREISVSVINAMHRAIICEVDDAMGMAASEASESTLSDHAKILEKLGNRIGVPEENIKKAVRTIERRIGEIEEDTTEAPSPKISGGTVIGEDKFDDAALQNLFMPLMSEP